MMKNHIAITTVFAALFLFGTVSAQSQSLEKHSINQSKEWNWERELAITATTTGGHLTSNTAHKVGALDRIDQMLHEAKTACSAAVTATGEPEDAVVRDAIPACVAESKINLAYWKRLTDEANALAEQSID